MDTPKNYMITQDMGIGLGSKPRLVNKMKYLRNILFSLGIMLFITACVSLAEDVPPPPGYQPAPVKQDTAAPSGPMYPLVAPDPISGVAIYTEKCVACHGHSGLGDGPDASSLPNPVKAIGSPDVARQATPAEWFRVVTQGNLDRFMPPFTSLSERQRWDVIAYIFMLSVTDETLLQGQGLYQELCVSCHGESGKGDGPEAVGLESIPADFTNQAQMSEKTDSDLFNTITNGGFDMPSFEGINEEERWAITTYLRTLSFYRSFESPSLQTETDPSDVGLSQSNPTPESSEPQASPIPEEESIIIQDLIEEGAEHVGAVSVQVISGSGREFPPDLEVVLHAFDSMQEVFSRTMVLPDDGFVKFEDVLTPLDRVFQATVHYDRVTYGSNIYLVEAESITIDLELNIYGATGDINVLVIDRLHVFFEFSNPGMIQVVEVVIFTNQSGQTVIADREGEPAVTFSLPSGATNLNLQEDYRLDFLKTESGFGITGVRPSSEPYEIMYSYEMPYESEKIDLEIPVGLRTNAVIVMAPEAGVKIKSDQLASSGPRDVQGTSYSVFNGGNLGAGDKLSMTVSGRPKGSGSLVTGGDNADTNLVIGLGAFGFALIFVGFILYRRTRIDQGDYEEASEDYSMDMEGDDDIGQLMDAIIALDDLYRSGELPEEGYQLRRTELKSRLKKLIN